MIKTDIHQSESQSIWISVPIYLFINHFAIDFRYFITIVSNHIFPYEDSSWKKTEDFFNATITSNILPKKKTWHLSAQHHVCGIPWITILMNFIIGFSLSIIGKYSRSKSLTFPYDKTIIYEQICTLHIFISILLCLHRDCTILEHYDI
jgi:hypothetical protein